MVTGLFAGQNNTKLYRTITDVIYINQNRAAKFTWQNLMENLSGKIFECQILEAKYKQHKICFEK